MRAVVVEKFGPIENARLGEMPKPEPQAGEVVVEIRATAVNFVDLLIIGGKYQSLPPLPFVPGKGPAGVVAGIGPGVTGFNIGDRVLALAEQGGFGQFVAVKARDCYRLPDAISFTDAAASAVIYDTAWIALHDRARLAAGETVLVLGATGGVGLAAIQLAKAAGARCSPASPVQARPTSCAMPAPMRSSISRRRTCTTRCASRFTRRPTSAAPTSSSTCSAAIYSTPRSGRSPGAGGWW
jgi:NADPH2:quinone reductase